MTHSEKVKFRGDDEVLKELCVANGLSYDEIEHEGASVSSLEIFFSGFPRMVGLSFFPRLCQLTIVGQNLEIIEGLQCCPELRELWVAQCQVMDITGLENCLQLEKLYLYDNQISKIQNLQMLVQLQVLWLNNNCISEIQGLDNLKKLKELNLADNHIETIGHILEPNVNLQNLILSGNRIKSFKELTYLAHLPRLTELALNDLTSGPNPVCLLCNYATHVLYHMPGLLCLDTYHVSSSQVKEVAESIIQKKKMNYNMRVRMVQRSLAETMHRLMEKKQTMLHIPEESIRTLSHSLKNLERELSRLTSDSKVSTGLSSEDDQSLRVDSEDQHNVISLDSNVEEKILMKMDSIRERLAMWGKKMSELETLHERDVAHIKSCMEYATQFLLMELESVENIRFEEGCSTDPWFSSCCDLLHLRFSHSDYRTYDITGIKISKVIRVHNTALMLRFEEKLQMLLSEDSSCLSQNYQRRLENLFYIPNPGKIPEKEEILHILENGFKTAEQFKALGREEAVPLSNSLYLSEQNRMESVISTSRHSSFHVMDDSLLRHGWVILSKVFLGNSTPIRNGDSVEKNNYPTAHSVYLNIGTKHRNTSEVSNSGRAHGSESCHDQRKWFIFDNELVLPEYIIYFEYVTANQEKDNHMCNTEKNGTSVSEITVDREVLNMEPVLKPQPKLLILDDKMLLNVAQANVFSQITGLNLHGNSLSKLKDISRLTALKHLCISFNDFTQLDDIRHMHNLEFLDASFNCLITLEGIRDLPKLKELDVQWNKLTRAREDTTVLTEHTPALLRLNTRHNPWKRAESVRKTILAGLKSLTHLDDELITEEEATEAVQAADTRITQTCLLVHSSTNTERPRSLSLLSTAHYLCGLSQNMWNMSLQPDWMSKITALNLDGLRISELSNLSGLVNLRWASFNDNDISKVEGLESCPKLEELSLNNNNITTFTGLLKLSSLSRLSLDGNQLSFLDASVLEQLHSLTFLSLDKNHISSLHGIQRVRSLLELYISNNHIFTPRDIFYLKGLTNLIILDLHGNPFIEKLENYRIYVVFQISSLKALDGFAVEATEREKAKDMFIERLTLYMVSEKLGHSNYCNITSLSMPSNSIRIVDLSPVDLFDNLRSVNLDHNNLTSFSGLIYLPNIKSLSLNYNHIESILPRLKVQTHLPKRQILYNQVQSSGYGQQRQAKTNSLPLMGNLEELHLSHNGISNMAKLQLSRFTNLKALFLQGNKISTVQGLERLYLLRELALDKNQIRVFSETSFVGQTALLELHLSENRVNNLSHLRHMTELRKLYLGSNKLQEIAELEKLDALPSLTELCLIGNPVACIPRHRAAMVLRLSQLQILNGVLVTVEERTRAELLNTEPSIRSTNTVNPARSEMRSVRRTGGSLSSTGRAGRQILKWC